MLASRLRILYTIPFLIWFGCGENTNKTSSSLDTIPQESKSKPSDLPKIEILRTERYLFSHKANKDSIRSLLNREPQFFEAFYKTSEYPSPEVLVNSLYKILNNPSLDSVYQASEKVFGTMNATREEIYAGMKALKDLYPTYRPQKVYTGISGMHTDFYLDDSIAVIGLDFFLGNNIRYSPHLPRYILRRYRPEYIPLYIMGLASTPYVLSDLLDNTLLAEMIFYGKTSYLLKQLYPTIQDSLLHGYSSVEIREVHEHVDIIWKHFIDNRLLYETKHELVSKYVGERPNVSEIGSKCPGRIGRWLGYYIVDSYMKRNEQVTIQDLMKERDAKKIFKMAGFNPKKLKF